MKIQSNKPDVRGQVTSQDNLAAPIAATSLDLVFNLLLQIYNESPHPQADSPHKPISLTSDQQSDLLQTPEINHNDSYTSTILFDMQRMIANEVSKQLDKQMTIENHPTAVASPFNVTNKLLEPDHINPTPAPIDSKTNPPIPSPFAQQKQNFEVNQIDSIALSPEIKSVASKTKLADEISVGDLLQEFTNLNLKQVPNKLPEAKPLDIKTPSVDLDSQVEPVKHGINLLNNREAYSSPSKSQHEIQLQTDNISPSMATQHESPYKTETYLADKYKEALMNLGHLINSQTTQAANRSVQGDLTNAKLMTASHYDPSHYDLKIELAHSSALNTQLKEGYDAKIKLYPPELGHILAKLRINKNNVDLLILTENNQVKQVVESNLPLLKQHFHDQDINLTNIQVQTAQVSDRSQDHHPQNRGQPQAYDHDHPPTSTQLSEKKDQKQSSRTLVDTYA